MKNLLRGVGVAYVLLFAGWLQAAPYVDGVTGYSWRQLTETSGLTYAQLIADPSNGCSAATGECTGSLIADSTAGDPVLVSLAGWQWATVGEVGQLFADMGIPGFVPPYDPSRSPPVLDSVWAAAAVDWDGEGAGDTGHFYATANGAFPCSLSDLACRVSGLTRTLDPTGQAYNGIIHDGAPGGLDPDTAGTAQVVSTTTPTNRGIWLYQPIPEPATCALMLVGLVAVGGVVSRRHRGTNA